MLPQLWGCSCCRHQPGLQSRVLSTGNHFGLRVIRPSPPQRPGEAACPGSWLGAGVGQEPPALLLPVLVLSSLDVSCHPEMVRTRAGSPFLPVSFNKDHSYRTNPAFPKEVHIPPSALAQALPLPSWDLSLHRARGRQASRPPKAPDAGQLLPSDPVLGSERFLSARFSNLPETRACHTWKTMTKASRAASTAQKSLEMSYLCSDHGGSR